MRETTKDRKRGLQWSLMEQLEGIDYADDIVLILQRDIDMKEELLELDKEARKTALKINVKKTKSSRLNHTSEATFTIRQDTIEEVQDVSYLGSTVSTEGGTDQDIRIRIGKAARVFNTLRPIWRSTKLSLNRKLRIYNSNVKAFFYTAVKLESAEVIDGQDTSLCEPLPPPDPWSAVVRQAEK